MTFNLDRNIVFFDIESTGLNVIRDRIVQIALIKYFKDGREPEEAEMLINPGIPISKESMDIHGITPDMVANKPTFRQIAERLFNWIGDSDLHMECSMCASPRHQPAELYPSDGSLTILTHARSRAGGRIRYPDRICV